MIAAPTRQLRNATLILACALCLPFATARAQDYPDGWRPAAPQPPRLSDQPFDFNIAITPQEEIVDVPISIRVADLLPSEGVVLRAEMTDANDIVFRSWARFQADADGNLDLAPSAPSEGSYLSADANGLLWSMRAPDDAFFVSSLGWSQREVKFRIESARGFEEVEITRRYAWAELEAQEITGNGIEARFWLPRNAQAAPVIILLGGWGDGPSSMKPSLLAKRGFAVLDLGYHQRPNLPEELVKVPLETVTKAVDWLEEQPQVNAKRIGILGVSKGAELALLAAAHEPRIGAVAAWTPSSVAFQGISVRSTNPGSSWTLNGKDIPYIGMAADATAIGNSVRMLMGLPVSFRATYAKALKSAQEEAYIPVENIAGPILLAAGEDDQMWPAADMARQIVDRLERNAFQHKVTSIIDKKGGHRFDYSLWPGGGGPTRSFVRGGSPEINHSVGREVWRATREFFVDALQNEN